MYWRWNRIPELANLPPEERKRLWNEAKRDPFRPRDVLWLGAFLAVSIVGGIALIHVPRNLSIWIALPIFFAVVFGVGAIVDAMLIFRYRPIVRRLRGGG